MPEIFEYFEYRSFSSIWYWIVVILFWTRVTGRPLGVPADILRGATAADANSVAQIEHLLLVNVPRIAQVWYEAGALFIGIGAFGLASLAPMFWLYQSEPAAALLVILVPMGIWGFLRLRLAQHILATNPELPEICAMLGWHRFWLHILAAFSIFAAAIIGMYFNILLANPGF